MHLNNLLLDLVLSSEHVIDVGEVVDARLDVLDVSLGLKVLLEVGLLSEIGGSLVVDGSLGGSVIELSLEVAGLDDGRNVSLDGQREKSGSKTRSVREERDSLALQLLSGDKSQQRDERSVHRGGVHVTGVGGSLERRSHSLGGLSLGNTKEGLLDGLVGERGIVGDGSNLLGDLALVQALVVEVVVVEKSSVRLGDKLAGGHVEGRVVKSVSTLLVGVLEQTDLLGSGVVGSVGLVEGLCVTGQGVVAINIGVLGGQIRLVEIVGMLEVRSVDVVKNQGSVGANEHGNTAGTSGGSGSALCVEGNVTGNDDGVSAVPRSTLNPVDSVEQGVGSSVAGVDVVHTLNVAVLAKELHEHRLDGLGLVQKGFSTNLDSTNRCRVDVVVLEQSRDGGQGKGIDVLSVVDKGHVGLTKTNGVLASSDTVVLLELSLVDNSRRHVDLEGFDSNVLGLRHC